MANFNLPSARAFQDNYLNASLINLGITPGIFDIIRRSVVSDPRDLALEITSGDFFAEDWALGLNVDQIYRNFIDTLGPVRMRQMRRQWGNNIGNELLAWIVSYVSIEETMVPRIGRSQFRKLAI